MKREKWRLISLSFEERKRNEAEDQEARTECSERRKVVQKSSCFLLPSNTHRLHIYTKNTHMYMNTDTNLNTDKHRMTKNTITNRNKSENKC